MVKEDIIDLFTYALVTPPDHSFYTKFKQSLRTLLASGCIDTDILYCYKNYNIKISAGSEDNIIMLQYIVKAFYHEDLWKTLEYLLPNEQYIYAGGFYQHMYTIEKNIINILRFIKIIITYSSINVIDIVILITYYGILDYSFILSLCDILSITTPRLLLLEQIIKNKQFFYDKELYKKVKEIYVEEKFYTSLRYAWIIACII